MSLHPVFVFLGFSLFLCSCSGSRQEAAKDLCTGTKRPYQIKGKWYHPQDHYDYEESGQASWYGPGFHERPKSCGNTFDMHELSAAHKTLPIPSVVEVTNLDNGKKLKLVVDDRGPFVDSRIIDLSKQAAIELGTHNRGLGNVQVVALPDESKALSDYLKQFGRYGRVPDGRSWSDVYYQEIANQSFSSPQPSALPKQVPKPKKYQQPRPYAVQAPVYKPTVQSVIYEHANDPIDSEIDFILNEQPRSTPSSKRFTKTVFLEVGAFVQKQNAERLKETLSSFGPTALKEPSSHKGDPFFSVKIGPYKSEQEAQKIMEKLARSGHHGVKLTHQ